MMSRYQYCFLVVNLILRLSFVNADELYFSANDGDILEASVDDGDDETTIYEADGKISFIQFSADKSTMWFTDRIYNTLSSADVDGSNVETLYSGFSEPHDFYVDEDLGYFYVCDKTAGEVVRISTSDYSGESLVTGLSGPVGIVVYDDYLYVSDATAGYIYKIDLDGSNVEIIISGLSVPRSLLTGDGIIYYVEATSSETGYTGGVYSFSVSDYSVSTIISGIGSPNTQVVSTDGLTMYVTDDSDDCVYYATLADAPVTLDLDTACVASCDAPRALAILSTTDDDVSTDDDATTDDDDASTYDDDASTDDDDDDDDDDSSFSIWTSFKFWSFVAFILAVIFFIYAIRRYRNRFQAEPIYKGLGTIREEEPLISA
jgi:sugar lactone lactonase YvrE